MDGIPAQQRRPIVAEATPRLISIILDYYPDVQGIYRFGTSGTAYEREDSDVDLALLLPPDHARKAGHLAMSECAKALARALRRHVDLVNARLVSTSLRVEIIFGEMIYCADQYAVDEFEMLTLSYYQKLNQERADIVAEGLRSGRFYDV